MNAPGNDQKSQPSKKLAPSLASTRLHSEVAVGTGPPAVDVGPGREPETMEETMMPFPLPVGAGADAVGFCGLSLGFATQ